MTTVSYTVDVIVDTGDGVYNYECDSMDDALKFSIDKLLEMKGIQLLIEAVDSDGKIWTLVSNEDEFCWEESPCL